TTWPCVARLPRPANDLTKTSVLPGLRAAPPCWHTHEGRKTMGKGTVKWFNAQKGFGFIQPEDGGKDVFVHISAVERAGMYDLKEGQKLTYEVVVSPKNGKEAAESLQVVN